LSYKSFKDIANPILGQNIKLIFIMLKDIINYYKKKETHSEFYSKDTLVISLLIIIFSTL